MTDGQHVNTLGEEPAHFFWEHQRKEIGEEHYSKTSRFLTPVETMTFCSKENFHRLPSTRFLVVSYCVLSIVLDLYFKFSPTLPWTHLLTGTSPSLELIVIFGMLMNSSTGNKVAYYACTLDVILGVLCLLTLPVISVAENATGHHLHLPFVSSFHANFEFRVNSTVEFLYVTIFLGFVSTLLILLFLALDTLKFVMLRRICQHDRETAEKLNQAQPV